MDWKENKSIGIAAGVVLVLCVLVIIFVFLPKKIKMAMMSESNGEVFNMSVCVGADFPINNPKTGQRDLYPALKVVCKKCGWEGYVLQKPQIILTSEEIREHKEGGGMQKIRCPQCGGFIFEGGEK